MSLQDMNVQIGALILDGLAPSPQIRKKMVPQTKDETHGNDFIAKHVGSDYERKQKCFRAFFGCQNPLTVPPPRGECPNFKVDELFRWMRYILPEAWVCSPDLSADEQTAKCQCKTQHKSRCGRQKRLGDGVQCDAVGDNGYTVHFYFRNEPVPKHWLDRGFSPIHARLLHMYSLLKDDYYRVKTDNLFTAVKIAREAYAAFKVLMSFSSKGTV